MARLIAIGFVFLSLLSGCVNLAALQSLQAATEPPTRGYRIVPPRPSGPLEGAERLAQARAQEAEARRREVAVAEARVQAAREASANLDDLDRQAAELLAQLEEAQRTTPTAAPVSTETTVTTNPSPTADDRRVVVQFNAFSLATYYGRPPLWGRFCVSPNRGSGSHDRGKPGRHSRRRRGDSPSLERCFVYNEANPNERGILAYPESWGDLSSLRVRLQAGYQNDDSRECRVDMAIRPARSYLWTDALAVYDSPSILRCNR